MTIKMGLNQSALFNAQTEEFITLCSKWNINNVELRVPKLKEWLYLTSEAHIREVLHTHGTTVTAINSLDDFALVPQDNLKILELETEMIGRMCEAVECPLVIAPVGRMFGTLTSKKEVIEKTLERLEIVSSILAPHGAVVGLEPIAFPEFSIKTIHEADRICSESGISDIGLVVDYYNLFQGGMYPDDFFEIKSPIHMIHVNDAEIFPLDKLDVMYTRTFPNDGNINSVEWTLAALRSGYKGIFSLEIFMKSLWELNSETAMYKIANKISKFAEIVENKAKESE